MVDKVEVTVTDLEKKHKGKSGYENMDTRIYVLLIWILLR